MLNVCRAIVRAEAKLCVLAGGEVTRKRDLLMYAI